MRLRQSLLFVKDLPRMAQFYGVTLGVDLESSGLLLHAIPPHIAEGIEIASPPAPREDTPIKLIFEVRDLAADRARLAALGVSLIDRPWGGCDALDPEGNVFGLVASE